MKPYACIAPGQNAQYVGMGSDLFKSSDAAIRDAARRIFSQASDILGYDLSKLCFEGPREKLERTLYSQPAGLTHSAVCYEVFKALHQRELGEEFDFAVSAGASLGEYFALMIAGVMDFEATLRLVQERAKCMSDVIDEPGYDAGKQLCLSIDARSIDELCSKFGIEQSNCNYSLQTVVGGSEDAIGELAHYLATEVFPNEKLRRLRVFEMHTEAAFHTSRMTPVRRRFAPIVNGYSFAKPKRKVVSNCTGHFYMGIESETKLNLIHQIDDPVRWIYGMMEILKKLRQIRHGRTMGFFEFGGGKPDDNPPEKQRSSFGGITTKNLMEMKLKRNDIDTYECISERTILKTVEELKEHAGE